MISYTNLIRRSRPIWPHSGLLACIRHSTTWTFWETRPRHQREQWHVGTFQSFFFPFTLSTFSASSARQRCHGTIGLRPRSVEAGLLQRSTCMSPSVDISAVATCSTRGSYESCSIWSHATTSVPVYDNCTGCHSLCLLVIHNAAVGRAPAYITDLLQPAATTSSRSSSSSSSLAGAAPRFWKWGAILRAERAKKNFWPPTFWPLGGQNIA